MVQGEPEDVTGAEDESGTRGTAGKVEGNRGGECQTSAPPLTRMPSAVPERRGRISPYSGLGAKTTSTTTSPSRQATCRRRVPGAPAPSSWPRFPSPSTKASVTVTAPPVVVWAVSSTMVGPRYRRVEECPSTGRIDETRILAQHPAEDRRAVKTGEQNHSTEPPALTSAAERQSESMP